MAILILGIGNTLRADDGLGAAAIQALAAHPQLPSTAEPRAVHQLTPEIAAEIVDYQAVIFIDAGVDLAAGEIRRAELAPGSLESAFTHFGTPAGLLAAAETLYGVRVRGILYTVGAESFALDEALSLVVREAFPHLITLILEDIKSLQS